MFTPPGSQSGIVSFTHGHDPERLKRVLRDENISVTVRENNEKIRASVAMVALLALPIRPVRGDDRQDRERGTPVTVVGTVVDPACYLMHPQAADGTSHDECGRACALAGVPLGITDEGGKALYLTDNAGTKVLLPHLHQRVRASGRALKKSEPLTLEMPVGQNNTMSVRVDGGYLALTVDRVQRVQ